MLNSNIKGITAVSSIGALHVKFSFIWKQCPGINCWLCNNALPNNLKWNHSSAISKLSLNLSNCTDGSSVKSYLKSNSYSVYVYYREKNSSNMIKNNFNSRIRRRIWIGFNRVWIGIGFFSFSNFFPEHEVWFSGIVTIKSQFSVSV